MHGGAAIHDLRGSSDEWCSVVGTSPWQFTYSCRTAIARAAKVLRVGDRSPVLVPEYHCGSELDVFVALGYRILRYQVTRDLKPDLDHVRYLAGRHAPIGAIYVIGYFGSRAAADVDWSDVTGQEAPVIEDAALTLFSGHAERQLGDAMVASLPKFLSTPAGGILKVRGERGLGSPAAGERREFGSMRRFRLQHARLVEYLARLRARTNRGPSDYRASVATMPSAYRSSPEGLITWALPSRVESQLRNIRLWDTCKGIQENQLKLLSLLELPEDWTILGETNGGVSPVLPLLAPSESAAVSLQRVIPRMSSLWWKGRHPDYPVALSAHVDEWRDRLVGIRVNHSLSPSLLERIASALRAVLS